MDNDKARGPRQHALVVTGSYGAGHDSAAHEIGQRLDEAGWRSETIDIADLYPWGLGHLMRRAYFRQLESAPRTWSLLLRALDARSGRPSAAGRAACGMSGRLPAGRVAAAVGPETGFVISTHPFASQALGLLRRSGRLAVPVITYLTDPSVHPLWISSGVDQHLALHGTAAEQARALGARDVRLIAPLTPRVAPRDGGEGSRLRAALGLAPDTTLALISSGSEGAGDVRTSALDVRATGTAVPVVLCGHNERLRRSLEAEPGVVALGWVDGLTDIIRGADCLIQNSGGFTTLEALSLGTPLITYRPLPGHGETSSSALLREGLAPWPRSVPELGAAILAGTPVAAEGIGRQWAERTSLVDVLDPGRAFGLAS